MDADAPATTAAPAGRFPAGAANADNPRMTAVPPDFLKPEPPWFRPRPVWLAWAAVPVLVLALLLQIALADRDRLAADAAWRPRIEALCAMLGCTLRPWREAEAFHLTSREVRPHPGAPGALLISASFRNDARFAQPWPQLELSLANLEGDALALRRFTAREYLGAPPASPLIGPGQSASLTLEVRDPGKRAVVFHFEFR